MHVICNHDRPQLALLLKCKADHCREVISHTLDALRTAFWIRDAQVAILTLTCTCLIVTQGCLFMDQSQSLKIAINLLASITTTTTLQLYHWLLLQFLYDYTLGYDYRV